MSTYTRLPTNVDLCNIALLMAADKLAPSRIFTLHVGSGFAYWEGKKLLKQQGDRQDNPLHPYINLQVDPELGESEWFIADEHGARVGSPGCG